MTRAAFFTVFVLTRPILQSLNTRAFLLEPGP
eukprot:CAMPEP_0179279200 /NCGR_PEP_ID=MMETSP0797-20121207/35991_1 /TAXON_ID=47934 /ORGANISM="Dinophysis acuminata, Strain DAEP01" /LENGTH=31 /DNA_ID= /DNA_START= /DNA_END= /DNA_ORIENTATION=